MAGGVLNLISNTNKNNFMTYNPQITFFKACFHKHYEFSKETKREQFNGVPAWGGKSRCSFTKAKGDLLSQVSLSIQLDSLNIEDYKYLIKDLECVKDVEDECCCSECIQYQTSATYSWANAMGHLLLDKYTWYINGKKIDRRYGEILELNSHLRTTEEQLLGYNNAVARKDQSSFSYNSYTGKLDLWINLDFTFCTDYGSAFPLYKIRDRSEFTLEIKWRDFDDCWISNKPNTKPAIRPKIKAEFFADYIYLDDLHKRKLKKSFTNMMIEQIFKIERFFNKYNKTPTIDLLFSGYLKEIIFVVQREDKIKKDVTNKLYGNNWFDYSGSNKKFEQSHTIRGAMIEIAGTEFHNDYMPPLYYSYHHPNKHHTRSTNKPIYCYSFALKPEKIQPSGYCCMHDLQGKMKLKLQISKEVDCDYSVRVYGICYRELWIQNGYAEVPILF